ncbi:MAG: acetyl-CoA carboxylase [Janthinobacterium lividum]
MPITTMTCPLPGTFYRSPAPDQPPFKQPGETVAVGDTVGLIEVMKSFTAVTAEVVGTITRFHAKHEGAVMPGQPLVDIET